MVTVLEWLYKFPFLGNIVRYVVDLRPGGNFLERYADPEYNNPSGIFSVIADLGLVGGAVFAAIFGWIVGYFWRSLVQGRAVGIFYPICFLSLLEIFRIFYVTGGRAFPTVLALSVGYLWFQEKQVRSGQSVRVSRTVGAAP